MQDKDEAPLSGTGFLVRIYWLFLGNALLFFLLALIVERGAGFPSWLDTAFWLTVGSLLLARFMDIRFLNGQTGDGQPATRRHWRRHAMLLVPVALAGWIVAHALGRVLK